MARFDRDQSNHTQHSSAKLASSIPPSALSLTEGEMPDGVSRYGRGVRAAWSALALALLLSTVSLLAHDSTQQPVMSASPISAVTTPPLVAASPAQTAPGAAATSGASPDFDTAVPRATPVAIVNAPDRQSTPPSTPAPETSVFVASPGGGAISIPVANTPAAQPATRPGMLGSGDAISPTAMSSTPITLAAASSAAVQLAAHPRLILDANTLASLRQNVTANTPEWQALKAACDSYMGGTVNYPAQAPYPNLPNLGQGYEGDTYFPELMNVALCYQMLKVSNPTAAAPYGAKAVDLLMKMSTPLTSGSGNLGEDPLTDDGYVIRYYGVGFGLGYDWLYELLTTAQRAQVYTTANAWLAAFENPNGDAVGNAAYAYAHPQSNYFAGYFHAKAAIALGTYDENPSGPAQWSDWLSNQFATRVQPYYALHLLGGGWPEGFANYGAPGILNMSLPMREVMTATGQDLIHSATAPYAYPIDSANYAMHFTWPSMAYFDDRDTNHETSTTQPAGTAQTRMFVQILGELKYWGSAQVNVFHQYLNDVNAATSDYAAADAWLLFLETNPSNGLTPVSSLPLSYLAPGMNAVAARSDWTTSAGWMSFRSGPYVNNPNQAEEGFDQGSLALVKGGVPLLLNATGWLVHNPGGESDETLEYQDLFSDFNGTVYFGNRQIYNVYYVRHMNGTAVVEPYGQVPNTIEDDQVRTQVAAYEDGNDYVYVLATHIEDMYRRFSAGPGVAAWARQIVFLRPNRFVVYDRTTEGRANYDQYLAWHFPAAPVAGTAANGEKRLDVTYNGQYAGAMTVVLPVNTTTTTIAQYPGSNPVKVWQVQIRPPNTNVAQQWLTVFDLSTSATAVATASPVTVTQGAIVGVQLPASDANSVVISSAGAAGTPISGSIGYSVANVAAHHVITELAPNTGYTITATISGSVQNVSVSVGGTSMSSSEGVLDFNLSASGVVSTPPVISTLPISILPVPGFPQPYTGS